MSDRQLLDVCEKCTAESASAHGLRDDDIFDDTKRLPTIHRIRADGEKSGAANRAVCFNDQKKAHG